MDKILKKILIHFQKRRSGDILKRHYLECPLGLDITECCVPLLFQALELFPFFRGKIIDAAEAIGDILWYRFLENGTQPILQNGLYEL